MYKREFFSYQNPFQIYIPDINFKKRLFTETNYSFEERVLGISFSSVQVKEDI